MKSQSHREALKLSYFTLGYTLVECIAAVIFGILAGSTVLIAFGLDSLVESLSGSIMVWRFRQHSDNPEDEERLEKQAVKLVAYAFFVLSAYVLFESSKALYFHEIARPSPFGIVVIILSLIVMPILFWKKYKLGKSIGSRSLMADSKQTLACALLSLTALVGLGLDYFGFWWADPAAAAIIGLLLLREGYHTYQEQKLCHC